MKNKYKCRDCGKVYEVENVFDMYFVESLKSDKVYSGQCAECAEKAMKELDKETGEHPDLIKECATDGFIR